MVDPSSHWLFTRQAQRYALKAKKFVKNDKKKEILDILIDTNRPEYQVADFNDSKNTAMLTRICPKSCQLPLEGNATQQLALLQTRLYDTEKRLRLMQKRKDTEKKKISEGWKELEEKEDDLREQFISFNRFVNENKLKRWRAKDLIEANHRMIKQRQEKINAFEKEMKEMRRIKEIMHRNIQKERPIEEFLFGVVQKCGYNSILDVTNRYSNLMTARRLAFERLQRNMDVLQGSKKQLMKLIEEKNFVIMGLNNQIANLQARYENANIKALESEELVTQIKNNAVKQLGEIDMVKNSIWNVYVHMTTSKKHPIKIKKDNDEEQMMYINRTLTELSKVNKLIRKKATKVK